MEIFARPLRSIKLAGRIRKRRSGPPGGPVFSVGSGVSVCHREWRREVRKGLHREVLGTSLTSRPVTEESRAKSGVA